MAKMFLPAVLHRQIQSHLQATYPNEGGGFLIGHLHGDQRQVTEYRAVTNAFASEEQYHRYLMEEGAYQQAEDYADAQGLTLLGYFHSHPDSPAIPSEFDRIHAFPNFMYLILAVQGGQAIDSRVWELTADRGQFVAVEWEESI